MEVGQHVFSETTHRLRPLIRTPKLIAHPKNLQALGVNPVQVNRRLFNAINKTYQSESPLIGECLQTRLENRPTHIIDSEFNTFMSAKFKYRLNKVGSATQQSFIKTKAR